MAKLELSENTGMGEFTVYAPLGADDGAPGRIIVGSGTMQVIKNITFGEAPLEMMAPGMPTMVEAMATSDTEIKVTWEAPASDGGSDITGYMVQRGYMDADDMMWTDVDPAHTGMDMMYMDMGLMADTTYYYRVAAMNAEGMGEYSDGTAMAKTGMAPEPDEAPVESAEPDEAPVESADLGTVTGVSADGFNRGGSVQVSWTPAANAQSYIIIAVNLADTSDTRTAVVNDATAATGAVGGLTSGQTYGIFVAALGSSDQNTLSAHVQVVAN